MGIKNDEIKTERRSVKSARKARLRDRARDVTATDFSAATIFNDRFFTPARSISQRMSPALEHSPVELKTLIAFQSSPSMQPLSRHFLTKPGTTPSMVVPIF